MSAQRRVKVPTDANNHPMHRGMGVPITVNSLYLGAPSTPWVTILDLAAIDTDRIYCGIAITNPGSADIELAFEETFGSEVTSMVCPAATSLCLDAVTFGPGAADDSTAKEAKIIRARYMGASGTQGVGTIDYSAMSNPVDGMGLTLHSILYEFSSDMSANKGGVRVDIAATKDLTFTALVAKINATDPNMIATINTTTHIVTLKSLFVGTNTNYPTVDGGSGTTVTGAVFSGATLTAGSGGVKPTLQIW